MPLMICVLDEGEATNVVDKNGKKRKVRRGDIVEVKSGYKHQYLKPYTKKQQEK